MMLGFLIFFCCLLNKILPFGGKYTQISQERNIEMDKKVKFSERPLSVKIVYIATLAILVVCAVVVIAVSIASRKDTPEPLPTTPNDGTGENVTPDGGENETPKEEKPTFVSPVVGTVLKGHSLTEPVFSETLNEWRTHQGVDILTSENAPVFAAESGVVSAIYDDPFHGRTVEVTHSMNYKTVYSNLAKEDAAFVSVGSKVESGERIGTVGYTAIFEIADEPHLHFEMKSNGKALDPLAHITEESKQTSLGIKNESAA